MPTKLGGMTRSLNDGGQYIILEEGDYNFTVSTFERARFRQRQDSRLQQGGADPLLWTRPTESLLSSMT